MLTTVYKRDAPSESIIRITRRSIAARGENDGSWLQIQCHCRLSVCKGLVSRTLTLLNNLWPSTNDLFHTQESLFACYVVCTPNLAFLFEVNRNDDLLKEVIALVIGGSMIRHEEGSGCRCDLSGADLGGRD